MTTRCIECPLRRNPLFSAMSPDEVAFMQRFKTGEITIESGTPVLSEGSGAPRMFTVLRGLGIRYKTTEAGRRQVINFVFPGDFIGLQAAVMGEMQHSVQAVTRMSLCVFDRKSLWSLFHEHPERAYDLTWLGAVEEHILGETLTTIGQKSGQERICWAVARIFQRMRALGLVRSRVMPFPFRQQDLADALGLSLVHTNKSLAKLRRQNLFAWANGEILVPDIDALARRAGLDRQSPQLRPLI